MPVSNQTDKIYGSGNGVTTTFSFAFKIFDTTQLVVYLIRTSTGVVTGPLILNTDYTVSISSTVEGGSVTFVVAPASGYTWFVKRVVPLTQSAIIPTEGPLPGVQISNQLDLMTMMCIQVSEAASRAATLAPTSTAGQPILPDPVDGNVPVWNGTSGLMTNSPHSGAAVAASVTAAAASAAAAIASATAASASATAAAASAASAATNAASTLAALPAGIIAQWKGTIATIPSGWVLCDGSNSTPDLRDKFIVGARQDSSSIAKTNVTGSLTQTGGAATINLQHNHGGATGVQQGITPGSGFAVGAADKDHTHSIANDLSAAQSVLNPFYALAYIMKT